MSKKVPAPPVEPMLRGLMQAVESPSWVEALAKHVGVLEKARESGEIVCVATDPHGDLRLAGWILASGGKICYRFEDDRPAAETPAFWQFAANNYVWVTPTIELRKQMATAMQTDKALAGGSLKLPSSQIAPEDFIEKVTGIDPRQTSESGATPLTENLSLF